MVGDSFAASVTEASEAIREVVAAADELIDGEQSVSVTAIAGHIGLSKQATSGRVRRALDGGWLVNQQERRGRSSQLVLGDPLPERDGLPEPGELSTCKEGAVSESCPSPGL